MNVQNNSKENRFKATKNWSRRSGGWSVSGWTSVSNQSPDGGDESLMDHCTTMRKPEDESEGNSWKKTELLQDSIIETAPGFSCADHYGANVNWKTRMASPQSLERTRWWIDGHFTPEVVRKWSRSLPIDTHVDYMNAVGLHDEACQCRRPTMLWTVRQAVVVDGVVMVSNAKGSAGGRVKGSLHADIHHDIS